ncbi:MAG: pirin family protein [Betaproteobacteria bacterium]|nr:pirin family protein [Betaproteobacteria bacterium]
MSAPRIPRTLQRIIEAQPTSDGAGVKLRRSLGRSQSERLDPFLMLDEFSSSDPNDYIAGFPAHPHRGFETVTYLIDGHMLHEDHLGHRGDLKSGAVQWMSAGRGIVHSEMPQQERGRMRGFQLWINLPAREKMKPAGYRDIDPSEIPTVELPGGGRAKVIAGALELPGRSVPGPVQGLATDPLYLDVELPARASFTHPVKGEYNALIYVFEGGASVGPAKEAKQLATHNAGVLVSGDQVEISAGPEGARFLLLAGRPLGEPVVQYGPFVMNTREEIEQAISDYKSGEFTRASAA